jgi:hypothetical protein
MANVKCTRDVNFELNTVLFTFPSLDQTQFPPLEASLDRMRDVATQLALHGTSQKVGDKMASEKDPSESYSLAKEAIAALERGEWSAARTKGEPSATITIEAIASLRGLEISQVQTTWDSLDDEAKKRIRTDDNVKAAVLAIKAERAKAKLADAGATDTLSDFN